MLKVIKGKVAILQDTNQITLLLELQIDSIQIQ